MLLSFWKPAATLGLLFTMFGIEQVVQSRSSLFLGNPALVNYAAGALVAVALANAVMMGRKVLARIPTVYWVTAALFAYALVSLLWSADTEHTLPVWRMVWPYIVTVIFLGPLLIIDPEDLRTALYAMLAVGTIALVLMFADPNWQGRYIELDRGPEIGSISLKYGNPLVVASLGGYVAIVAILLNFKGASRFWQAARWLVVAVALANSIRSGSRGQLLALLIAIMVFLPISRRFVSVRGVVTTFGAIAAFVVLAYWAHDLYAERYRWEWDTMYHSYYEGRVYPVIEIMTIWINSSPINWIFGLGNSYSYDPNVLGGYPHVVMIEVLCEEGLIGFVLLWSIVILAFRSVKRIYPYVREHPEARGLLAAVASLFLFEVVLSFKQGNMLGSQTAFAFAIILGRTELAVRHRMWQWQQVAASQAEQDAPPQQRPHAAAPSPA